MGPRRLSIKAAEWKHFLLKKEEKKNLFAHKSLSTLALKTIHWSKVVFPSH